MDNLVEDIVALFNNTHWDRVKQYPEIYSVDGDVKTPNVHVEDITKLFKDNNYTALHRKCEIYPIELSVTIKGVKFYSIHSLEDFSHVS